MFGVFLALAVLIADYTLAKKCVFNTENCARAFLRCGLWPVLRTNADITLFLARAKVASQLVVNETNLGGVLFRGVDVTDSAAADRAFTTVRTRP